MTYRATIAIERNGLEISVEVEGIAHRAHRGRKDHPMDRFAPPDEEAYAEVTESRVAEDVIEGWGGFHYVRFRKGESIDLTDLETERAEEAIMEAASDQAENDRESAYEERADRELNRRIVEGEL